MPKIVLNFDSGGLDNYARVIAAAAAQEKALNAQLAETTLRLAAQDEVSKKVADAYKVLSRAATEYALAKSTFKQAAGPAGDQATNDDLQALAEAAKNYQNALQGVKIAEKDATQENEKHGQSHQSLTSKLGLSERSLTFVARGLAEFGGQTREVTGLITALGSITDVQSGIFVVAGLALTEIAKRVQEADKAYENLSRRQAMAAVSTHDLSGFLKKQGEDATSTAALLRQVPDVLGRFAGARIDDVIAHPEHIADLGAVYGSLQKAINGTAESIGNLSLARLAAGEIAAAQEPKLRNEILMLAAEGAGYDEVYAAVAKYRQQTFQASEDKTEEAANVFKATAAWMEAGKALREYGMILTVAEQAQQSLDDSVRSSAQGLKTAQQANETLSTQMGDVGRTSREELDAIQKLAGAHADEEIAIKKLIPVIVQEKIAKGESVDYSKEGLQAIHDEAQGLVEAQIAYLKYVDAVQAAAQIQGQLTALETQHAEQLNQIALQTQRRGEDNARQQARHDQDQQIAYAREAADREAALARQREDAARSLAVRLGDIDEEANRSRAKAAENYGDTRERIERDYNDAVARINQQYSDSLFDLETNDDAKGIVRARLQRDRALRDAAQGKDKQNEDAKRSYDKQQREFEDNLQHQKELLERDYQRQLENIAREGERQRQESDKQHSRQNDDYKRALDRQNEDARIADARRLADVNSAYQAQHDALEQALSKQQALIDAAYAQIKQTAVDAATEVAAQAQAIGDAIRDAAQAAADAVANLLDPVQWQGALDAIQQVWDNFIGNLGKVELPTPPENPDTGLNAGITAGVGSDASTASATDAASALSVVHGATGGGVNDLSYAGNRSAATSGGGEVTVYVHNSINDPMLDSRIEVVSSGVTAKVIRMARGRG